MDNDILQVTISNPGGIVTGLQYNGIDNLLAVENDETDRGYTIPLLFFFYFSSLFGAGEKTNQKQKPLTSISPKFFYLGK